MINITYTNIIVLVLGRLILRIWMQPLQPYPCPYRLLPDSPWSWGMRMAPCCIVSILIYLPESTVNVAREITSLYPITIYIQSNYYPFDYLNRTNRSIDPLTYWQLLDKWQPGDTFAPISKHSVTTWYPSRTAMTKWPHVFLCIAYGALCKQCPYNRALRASDGFVQKKAATKSPRFITIFPPWPSPVRRRKSLAIGPSSGNFATSAAIERRPAQESYGTMAPPGDARPIFLPMGSPRPQVSVTWTARVAKVFAGWTG